MKCRKVPPATCYEGTGGGGGIAVPTPNPRARRGWVANAMLQALYPWERDPVPILQEAGWTSGLVWRGTEKLTPRGFEPLIIQPVSSCFTDYASPDRHFRCNTFKYRCLECCVIQHVYIIG